MQSDFSVICHHFVPSLVEFGKVFQEISIQLFSKPHLWYKRYKINNEDRHVCITKYTVQGEQTLRIFLIYIVNRFNVSQFDQEKKMKFTDGQTD